METTAVGASVLCVVSHHHLPSLAEGGPLLEDQALVPEDHMFSKYQERGRI